MSSPKARSSLASRRTLARIGALALLALLLATTTGCKKRHKALELYREGYRVFRYEEDLKRAEGILQKALEVDPTLTQAYLELAAIYIFESELGSKTLPLAKAEQNLREAIRIAPDHIYAHFWLGRVAYVKGELDEALNEFDITIKLLEWPFGSELGGDWKELYLYQGYILLDGGNYTKAETSFDKFNAFSPDKYFYLGGVMMAAEALGDSARAEAISRKISGKYVLVEPAAYRGLVEMFRGHPDRAAGIFEKRLEKLNATSGPPGGNPDQDTLYLKDSYQRLLAWAYTKAGRSEEAKGLQVGKKEGRRPSSLEVLRLALSGSVKGGD